MCGRYTLTGNHPQLLAERFGLDARDVDPTTIGRFNVCPTEPIAIVTGEGAQVVRWGLVPSWAKALGRGPTPINARAETVAAKAPFAKLIARPERRCLVLADGWYEWLRPERPKGPAVPFRYVVDGGAPFAFAGLWTAAYVEGERVTSAAIVTTPANAFCRPVHDRMPCVLPDREAELAWLSADAAGAQGLLAPLGDARCSASPANVAVNRAGVEGPHLLVPRPDEREPEQLSLT